MTEEHRDKEQAARPPHHPEDDEIDLAELVGVLFRRWPWILGCTLLAVLIGVGYSLTLPSLYSFTSMVQIGQYQTPEKEYKFIQSPPAAAQQLKATAQTVYKKRNNGENTTGLGFSLNEDFQVAPSEQGGILEIALKAANPVKAKEFLQSSLDKFLSSHERPLQVRSQKYHQRIQTLEAELKELRQKIKSYNKRMQLLENKKSHLKRQIEDYQKRIDTLLQTKSSASFSKAQEPIGLLLFSSKIQRIRSHIDTLQTRLNSKIPEQKQNIRDKKDNIQTNITTKKAELESQKIALNNMMHTEVLIEPSIPESPSPPDYKLYVALSLVLGLFLGVFTAFLREFWIVNRARILGKTE